MRQIKSYCKKTKSGFSKLFDLSTFRFSDGYDVAAR